MALSTFVRVSRSRRQEHRNQLSACGEGWPGAGVGQVHLSSPVFLSKEQGQSTRNPVARHWPSCVDSAKSHYSLINPLIIKLTLPWKLGKFVCR